MSVRTPIASPYAAPPSQTRTMPIGMPMAATSRRALSKVLRPATAEPPLAPGVVFDRPGELRRVEIGPEERTEVQFRVCRLPEQEVAEAQLTGGAYDQIRLTHVRRVQVGGHNVLIDLFRGEPRAARSSHGVDDLLTASVIEGHEQVEHGVGQGGRFRVLEPSHEVGIDLVAGP